jgi:hypothetical protein
VGRPSKAEAYREVLAAALTEEPTLRSVELLHRARQAGYTGGKSAIYAFAQTLRVHGVTPWFDSKASSASFRSTTSVRSACAIKTGPSRSCISLHRA